MNRSHCLVLASVFVALIPLGIAVEAGARPEKIDYHAAICQRASAGSPLLTYDVAGIHVAASGSTTLKVVCPLDTVTEGNASDAASTQVSFKLVDTQAVVSCSVRMEDTWLAWIYSSQVSGTTTFVGSGTYTFPLGGDTVPTSIAAWCEFGNGGGLGAIQLTTKPSNNS